MRGVTVFALGVALSSSSAGWTQKAPCPPREAGQSYPWQTSGLVRGDQYAWVIVTVDRTGRPIRCGIGDNNIPDRDMRFWLCKAYSDDWRAPAAQPGDPETRTIKRKTIMPSYDHQMANKKARKAWFQQHPEERSECYPE